LNARYFSDEFDRGEFGAELRAMPCTTAMIAKAMPQAIRQYSIAWRRIRRSGFCITTDSVADTDCSAPMPAQN